MTKPKNKQSVGVALIGTSTNENALQLLQKISALKEQRRIIEETPFKCGSLRLRNEEVSYCRDLDVLISMAADVISSMQSYEQAATVVGLKKYPTYKIKGHSAEDVLSDIKLSIALTTQVEQNAIIDQMEKIAAKYMTPDDEKARDFEILQNLNEQFNSLQGNIGALN